jgi:SAM-dependent methyltransferase
MSDGDIEYKSDRERLRDHFAAENTPNRWDDLWSTGTWLPWDRGTPNPALIDVLSTQQEFLGSALATDENGKTRRKRALVPGCGKGYDVFLFAAFGYDAFGLEGSKHAVKACEGLRGEAEGKEKYKVRDAEAGRGEVKFVLGDFFGKDWEKETGGGEFDVIYDYTVSCLHLCQKVMLSIGLTNV